MDESSDGGRPSPGEFIEEALIEVHHLANLTDLAEAKLARRRLIGAQSASRRTETRDLLTDACEYLELAKLERRDAAAGFVKARRFARNAELGLRHERPTAVEEPVAELLDVEQRDRRVEETIASTAEWLRQEAALAPTFGELRSRVQDDTPPESGHPDDHDEAPSATVEEALQAASLEVDIRRALQNSREARAEAEFSFLSSDQLRPPRESTGST